MSRNKWIFWSFCTAVVQLLNTSHRVMTGKWRISKNSQSIQTVECFTKKHRKNKPFLIHSRYFIDKGDNNWKVSSSIWLRKRCYCCHWIQPNWVMRKLLYWYDKYQKRVSIWIFHAIFRFEVGASDAWITLKSILLNKIQDYVMNKFHFPKEWKNTISKP